MADEDELEWRAAMVSWAEATHDEVRSIRRMVQVFSLVWVIAAVGAALIWLWVASDSWG